MAKLDADMQSLVRRTILCFAATINGDGSPNLSPKSTLSISRKSRKVQSRSLIIDETNTTDNDFNKQEKPMSSSSMMADSSAPSANHTIIRVGLIGVGNWALNGPVRVLSLMPQYEMAAVYSQRRDAAQSAADTFGIRHVVGSIDELVR